MVENMTTETWLENFIGGLLERMGFDLWVEEIALDEKAGELRVQLAGPDTARAIGREGQTLEALQYLVVAAASHAGLTASRRIVIDIEGYRQRRDDRIMERAARAAAEVLDSGEPVTLEPMPARERRLVHLVAAGIEGVTTLSEGEGEERRVRLVPDARR